MKRFIVLTALALGLVSCSACAKKVPTPVVVDAAPAPVDAGADVTDPKSDITPLSFENVYVTLPGQDWAMRQLSAEIVIAIGPTSNLVVFVGKEPTKYNLEGYTLYSIREIREAGGIFLSSKQVEIDGTKYTLLEANKGASTLLSWLTVKDGVGYSFTCSSETTFKPQDACGQIASTLKIH